MDDHDDRDNKALQPEWPQPQRTADNSRYDVHHGSAETSH